MSLAATLAASGMRPASFLPTVKCSSCGDEIEISVMGEHQCNNAPLSPSAAQANMNNPFTLRQMNASETKPSQPSPLQFSSDPAPAMAMTRPRAPTVGSNQAPVTGQTSLSKPPRPPLPRINSAVANQPYLGPSNQGGLISPASSVRSGSSGSSKRPLQRAVSKPVPRIFDPRPPSPELTANMDCAFPPFPATPVTSERKASTASSHRRKASGGSSHRRKPSSESRSSRKSSRREGQNQEIKSPTAGAGESTMSRTDTRRSDRSDSTSKRSTKEDRSSQEAKILEQRPSQQVETLSPVEEHPPMSLSIPLPLTAASDMPHSPMSATADSQPLGLLPAPSEKKEVSDLSTKPEAGTPSISNSIRRAVGRKLSLKKGARLPLSKPEEAVPAMPDIVLQPFEHQSSQRKVPPQRPARPEEGLPPDLLHPLSPIDFSQRGPSPPPVLLRDTERSQTLPLPTRTVDEAMSPTKLSKMPSEPILQSKAGPVGTPPTQPSLSTDQNADDSRMDYRMQDAPPVPKPVQVTRSDSGHKSSDSNTSTASSVLSLSNISLGNSNTTSGTSPMASATSSVDASLPFMSESARNSVDDSLRVAALNVNPQQKRGSRAGLAGGISASQPRQPSQESESVPSLSELATDFLRDSSENASWPLESPTDPSLHEGRLAERDPSPRSSPSEATLAQLAPDSPKLERLSSDTDETKLPASSDVATEREMDIEPKSEINTGFDFLGFNFDMPSPLQIQPRERTPSPVESPMQAKPPSAPLAKDCDESSQTQAQPPEIPVVSHTVPEQKVRPASSRRSTALGKAVCRGCNKRIEGKSVKAADGRLTGRWHRACFVCQTCKAPFETADFYVINNLPYCEQHYHEENGSICYGCHTGIEGQFLQTTDGAAVRKYHRRCFTCVDCRLVLSEDYFEVDGRIHCERHAFAATRSRSRRAPPGPNGLPGSRLRAESFKSEWRRR